jgi:hypothetical protein
MYKKVLTACAGFVVLLLVSGMAFAGVPCAGTTTVSATGDSGDLHTVLVTVTVRDCYGTPLAGQTVDFSPAGVAPAVFCFCDSVKTAGPTDVNGQTTASYADFGGCGDLQFYATIGTVVAGPSPAITIGSPDSDGDCDVDLVDFGKFASAYFGTDTCYDYNCDGTVDLIDFGIFATQGGDAIGRGFRFDLTQVRAACF